jgi:AraC-like DNA-binding protein
MEAAKAELMGGRSSVARVAEIFGYASESAFRSRIGVFSVSRRG